MPVFSEVVGLVLGATGLVFASDYEDFPRYEFLRWGCGEVPVIGWVFANRVDIAMNCFGVFVITECSVRLLALFWVRRVWFSLQIMEIFFAMNSLDVAVVRYR